MLCGKLKHYLSVLAVLLCLYCVSSANAYSAVNPDSVSYSMTVIDYVPDPDVYLTRSTSGSLTSTNAQGSNSADHLSLYATGTAAPPTGDSAYASIRNVYTFSNLPVAQVIDGQNYYLVHVEATFDQMYAHVGNGAGTANAEFLVYSDVMSPSGPKFWAYASYPDYDIFTTTGWDSHLEWDIRLPSWDPYLYIQAYVSGAQYLCNAGIIVDLQFSTVPEPSSLLLVGVGLLGLAGIRKKIRKQL